MDGKCAPDREDRPAGGIPRVSGRFPASLGVAENSEWVYSPAMPSTPPVAHPAICLVDGPPLLADALERAGCAVLRVQASPEPVVDLPAALDRAGFAPDLVLQVERLGPRSVLSGLEGLDCPLLLWCIDPHLNSHWHAAYARLFDLACSTQRAWMESIGRFGAPDVRWLPWFGQDLPQVPWEAREHGLAFVGRVTRQRPARRWMTEFLARKGANANPAILQEVPYQEMLALYGRSKLIPNESIFGEVNFRLFEGASCGCLVLGQDIAEQADLFEPGREMDTYAHVVELGEKLDLYLGNDRLTRTMGRAARARVLAEHQPEHRAARILEYGRDAARNRATGREAAKWSAITLASLWEAGMPTVGLDELLRRLAAVPGDADVAAAALRVQVVSGMDEVLDANLSKLLERPAWREHVDLNLAASMACLYRKRFKDAGAFLCRYLESRGKEGAPYVDPKALLTRWARELERLGRILRPGFPFDTKRHLPAAASDCLMCVLEDAPDDLPTLRLLDSLLARVPGSEQNRVGLLSILTLHERGDWRPALELGLADLGTYRLDSGLDELRLALSLARERNAESAFLRVLKARDPSGLLLKRLS